MKNITIQSGTLKDFVFDLKSNFNGSLDCNANEYKLTLDNALIKGSIEAIAYQEEMKFFDFDIVFLEDVQLTINSISSSPTYFAYCSEGTLEHSFGISKNIHSIKAQQNAVINTVGVVSNVFHFKKNIAIKLALIGVVTAAIDEKDSLNSKIKNTFINQQESFVHIGIQHINISQKLEQLRKIDQKGIVRNLLKKGILQIILAMEIEHHSNKYNATETIINCLTLKQIDQIKLLSSVIQKEPADSYSIKSLAKQTGLSPNKLQEGFKLIHNTTVNDFITLIRIEKAESLIRNTDLNISEIVYSIGFTSRSYFSKIFKQKYNCSPKEYKYSQNSLAITA